MSPLFILGKDLAPQPHGPKALHDRLGKDYPFVANIHRGFLRTHLVDHRACDVSLDAFLGHAGHGCEPFTSSSTFDFTGYRIGMREALSRILDKVGWEVVEGLA